MFDLSFPALPGTRPAAFAPFLLNMAADSSLTLALTTVDRSPAATMSGEARTFVLDRFATLAEAMHGAAAHAEQIGFRLAPQMLAILDREDRLVLAGAASESSVVWCHPVTSRAEARLVVSEASQLRGQAARAADWQETDLAAQLHQRADLLEARLVDPLWRAFAAHALQIAA